MSNQQVKVYFRKNTRHPGMYYIRNGLVRYMSDSKNSHWIDSTYNEAELDHRVSVGLAIGPIIVNNFQEKES